MSVSDRRSARRFESSDGKLRLHTEPVHSTGHDLVDFSYNSARFVASESFRQEQELIFDLTTAGHDINTLKGYVVRVDNAEEFQDKYFVVIKFLPFSTLEKFNTLENYRLLKTLIAEMESKGPDPRVR